MSTRIDNWNLSVVRGSRGRAQSNTIFFRGMLTESSLKTTWKGFWDVVKTDFPNLTRLQVQAWQTHRNLVRTLIEDPEMLEPLRGRKKDGWVLMSPWDIESGDKETVCQIVKAEELREDVALTNQLEGLNL